MCLAHLWYDLLLLLKILYEAIALNYFTIHLVLLETNSSLLILQSLMSCAFILEDRFTLAKS